MLHGCLKTLYNEGIAWPSPWPIRLEPAGLAAHT
jgi:hypothetical protein